MNKNSAIKHALDENFESRKLHLKAFSMSCNNPLFYPKLMRYLSLNYIKFYLANGITALLKNMQLIFLDINKLLNVIQ